jgi:DNA (cytosine-5)-methyltransferase 1
MAIDILVGGTPCQSFSFAGPQGGLSDERGILALEFIKLTYRTNPEFFLWENVPGALAANKGQDFQCLLRGFTGVNMAVPEKGWANTGIINGIEGHYSLTWRVLDAKHFGVPQNRRRLYVVGHSSDWARAAAVLLDQESIEWNTSEAYSQAAAAVSTESHEQNHGSWWDGGQLSQTLDAVLYKRQCMPEKSRFPAVLVPAWERCEVCEDFLCNIHHEHAADCTCPAIDEWADQDLNPYEPTVLRYLTEIECERLMGFQDDYTKVPFGKKMASAGPRYKALGNSMVVPVMRWIGERMHRFSRKSV